MFFCDEPCNGQLQALDNEALKAAIVGASTLMCGELARQFNVSNETVRLHLYHIGKRQRVEQVSSAHSWKSTRDNE